MRSIGRRHAGLRRRQCRVAAQQAGVVGKGAGGPRSCEDPRFRGGRWDLLKLDLQQALCGPVQQSGRYLGIIEVVNPEGGGAFQQMEINALDYICDQLAEFVASRPIVLEDDAIMPPG
jgi:hypothetical protein